MKWESKGVNQKNLKITVLSRKIRVSSFNINGWFHSIDNERQNMNLTTQRFIKIELPTSNTYDVDTK